jgi:hypothetical protein
MAITNPTSWNRALLEKLIVTQLVKKFPAIYATGRFITVLTSFSEPLYNIKQEDFFFAVKNC